MKLDSRNTEAIGPPPRIKSYKFNSGVSLLMVYFVFAGFGLNLYWFITFMFWAMNHV